MKNNELKKILKPLIKQCIKEVIFEEGVLSSLISEVVQGLGTTQLVESKAPPAKMRVESDTARRSKKKERLQETRKKMLDAIGKDGFGGVDIFEGTEPLSSAGNPSQGATPSSPLSGIAPNDPGVNIDGIMSLAGANWKKLL